MFIEPFRVEGFPAFPTVLHLLLSGRHMSSVLFCGGLALAGLRCSVRPSSLMVPGAQCCSAHRYTATSSNKQHDTWSNTCSMSAAVARLVARSFSTATASTRSWNCSSCAGGTCAPCRQGDRREKAHPHNQGGRRGGKGGREECATFPKQPPKSVQETVITLLK